MRSKTEEGAIDRIKPWWTERIATLEDELDTRKKALAAYIKNKELLEARVKAADDALFLAIKNKEKAEDDERLGRTRIAALEALGKELDQLEMERITSIATLKARVEELDAELSGWQQNYADQMSDPKQREAYLSQLKKRKERGLNR